jgi:hypothetical protein
MFLQNDSLGGDQYEVSELEYKEAEERLVIERADEQSARNNFAEFYSAYFDQP